MLSIACIVDQGIIRLSNDDRAAVNSSLISEGLHTETADSSCLVIVCDGVGGVDYGNEAAEIVTDIFSRLSGTQLTEEIIRECIDKANDAVIMAQNTDVRRAKMATTVAGLYIDNDDFIAFNVGDTRVYRYRTPYIAQISKDHSLWREKLDSGGVALPEHKGRITRCLGGGFAVPEIVRGDGRVYVNDVFVLCTDGVWGVLDDDDFERVLVGANERNTDVLCGELINLALEKGSDDNLSIILVRRFDNGAQQ